MLSASTISSGSSEAFSPRTASSTPLSQYSNSSTPKTSGNPLTELIETEKSYMETLRIIDSQLAPLWTDTSVTDFTELLKYVHDVLKANKRFCSKLTRIAANPQTIKELGDVLMQWIDDMEVPYANYSRAYISNLNTRKDILSNPAIQQLLQDLSRSASYEITLESLFNAPVQQLKYYKVLYGRLLDSAEPGRADHKLLVKANKRIDTVMLMAQKNMSSTPVAEQHSTKSHHSKALPIVTPIQTDVSATASSSLSSMDADLGAFQRQLDSSQAKDIFNGAHVQCQPRLATPGAKILLRDNFILLPDGLDLPSAQRVHVVLTTYVLVITQESNGSYRLMFPPIAVYDISVNAAQVDRELIGEYNVQVDVLGRKKILLRADTKETRNKWVGIDENASGSAGLTAKPMRDIVSKLTGDAADKDAEEGDKPVRTARKSVIRKQDIISFYTDQSGEISPLSSDESDAEDKFSLFGAKTPFSTKYDRTSKIDPSVKDLPPPPPTANAAAPPPTLAKDISPVPPPKQSHANHLQPATSIDNRPLPRAPSPVTSHHLENSGHSRPVSPRTIEIKHTVAPVAMQATTQSSEFLTNDDSNQSGVVDNGSSNGPAQQQQQPLNTNLPRTSSISRSASPAAGRPLPTPTRSSSFRQQQQQQQQQFAGGSAHPRPSEKALPQQPPFHHQSEQQHYYQHHHQPQPRLQSAAGPQQNMAQHWSPQQHQPPSPSMMAAPQQYRSAPSSPTQRPMMMGGNIPPMNRAPSPGMGSGGYPGQLDAPRAAAASNYLNVQRPSLAHHRSMEDLNSPPRSPTPNGQPSSIKQTLYSNGQCEVFHWKSESWYAVDGHCLLQVRQTFTNRSCVAIQLQNTGQLYLNAWILPNTVIAQPSPTDVSLTVHMGTTRENYLVHFPSPADATTLFQLLQRMHQEAVQMNMTPENSSTLRGAPPGMSVMMNRSKSFDVRDLDDDPAEDTAKVPQTLRLVMQCKCKLFVQNEHSNWSSFGSVTMKISQQLPSKKMHIEIENGKGPKATKLVSASVQSRNVERISPKRITFLLINEQERTSMVYMVQIKEEETGNKIFEYLKTKNAENGW